MPVLTLAEQVHVEVRQLGRITVRIVGDMLAVLVVTPDNPVVLRYLLGVPFPLEDVRTLDPLQPVVAFGDTDFLRMGQEHPYLHSPLLLVPAEHLERIVLPGLDELLQRGGKFWIIHAIVPRPDLKAATCVSS